jgi:UDP-N-acetylglucosamine acyltransferase
MPTISPLACVDPKAELAADVDVGPFCVIGPNVTIGAGTKLMNNVTVLGHTTIGAGNLIFPNAVLGTAPQDLKYRGAPTRLIVGNNNQIREAVTLHIGTEKGGGVTSIGDSNLLMVNTHIGHDATFGSRCILGNNVMIAGHVVAGDNVVLLGAAGVHHFVTIGDFAYIAGAARIHHDVPPFVKVAGDDEIRALNKVGLRRAGVSEPEIEELDDAFRKLFVGRGKKAFSQRLAEFNTTNGINPHVARMVEFLRRRDQGKHGRYLEGLRK